MIRNRAELMDAMNQEQGQGYLVVGKMFNQEFGYEVGVLLSHMIDANEYFLARTISNDDKWDGWFFQTVPTVHKALGMSERKQDRIVAEMVATGLIDKDVRYNNTIKKKLRCFKINWKAMTNFMRDKVDERIEQYNRGLYDIV